jgi:hypothetical protein
MLTAQQHLYVQHITTYEVCIRRQPNAAQQIFYEALVKNKQLFKINIALTQDMQFDVQ